MLYTLIPNIYFSLNKNLKGNKLATQYNVYDITGDQGLLNIACLFDI